jgi:hypothetical protein
MQRDGRGARLNHEQTRDPRTEAPGDALLAVALAGQAGRPEADPSVPRHERREPGQHGQRQANGATLFAVPVRREFDPRHVRCEVPGCRRLRDDPIHGAPDD